MTPHIIFKTERVLTQRMITVNLKFHTWYLLQSPKNYMDSAFPYQNKNGYCVSSLNLYVTWRKSTHMVLAEK